MFETSTFSAILRQLCPRCRAAPIFRETVFPGLARMYESCPACGLKFQREAGYFLGAMYISYGLGVITLALIGLALWLVTAWPITKVAVWAVLLFLPTAPILTLFSRVLWIYLDQAIDPEKSGRDPM